jgi:hypothetical protein
MPSDIEASKNSDTEEEEEELMKLAREGPGSFCTKLLVAPKESQAFSNNRKLYYLYFKPGDVMLIS